MQRSCQRASTPCGNSFRCSAVRRGPHPTRLERGGGHRRTRPRHPAGRPITGVWCRPRCSTRWKPNCGGSPSRTTAGYSVNVTAAPTWSSSPGPASLATSWSRVRPHPMTLPWPATGLNGARSPGSHPSLPGSGSGGGSRSPAGR
jgi:hypothetical protein